MFKQSLIDNIISKKMHFTIPQKDDADDKQHETWFAFQTLEQHQDKMDEMGKWINAGLCDGKSEYDGLTTWDEFDAIMKEKMVKKYGNQYLENIL